MIEIIPSKIVTEVWKECNKELYKNPHVIYGHEVLFDSVRKVLEAAFNKGYIKKSKLGGRHEAAY